MWDADDNTGGLVDNEFEIYGQRLTGTGVPVGTDDFRISDMGPNGSTAFNASEPDVAYNATSNEYLVVWSGDDNTGGLVDFELEVFGQRLNAATGAALGTNDFRISDMGPDGDPHFVGQRPAVAHNSANNEYLVVWEGDENRGQLVDGDIEIFGQRLNGATGAEAGANDFRISDMGPNGNTAFAARNPDVAYNSTADEYLVVWGGNDDTAPLVQSELEVFGQRLNASNAAELGANDFRISDMGRDGVSPFNGFGTAIAHGGASADYLVVWFGDDDKPPLVDNEFETFGQRLTSAGGELGANDFRISSMGPPDLVGSAQNADVAYNSVANEYLVVWVGG